MSRLAAGGCESASILRRSRRCAEWSGKKLNESELRQSGMLRLSRAWRRWRADSSFPVAGNSGSPRPAQI